MSLRGAVETYGDASDGYICGIIAHLTVGVNMTFVDQAWFISLFFFQLPFLEQERKKTTHFKQSPFLTIPLQPPRRQLAAPTLIRHLRQSRILKFRLPICKIMFIFLIPDQPFNHSIIITRLDLYCYQHPSSLVLSASPHTPHLSHNFLFFEKHKTREYYGPQNLSGINEMKAELTIPLKNHVLSSGLFSSSKNSIKGLTCSFPSPPPTT